MAYQGENWAGGISQKTINYTVSDSIGAARPSENSLTTRDWTFEDPCDLGPAIRILTDVIEEELDRLDPEEPLVILMGEGHSLPVHMMLQIGVMKHLAGLRDADPEDSSRNFVMASEMPFNNTAVLVQREDTYGLDIPENLKYRIQEHDPDGHLGLEAIITKNPVNNAPRSKERVFQTALQYEIPTVFNDAARKEIDGNTCLDLNDPQLANAVPEESRDMNVPLDSPLGYALRNRIMMKRAFEFAHKQTARIIFQACGTNHLFGVENNEAKYSHSLASQFKAAGCRTLGIFITSESNDCTPEQITDTQAWQEHSNTVILRGLDDKACYKSSPATEERYLEKLEKSFNENNGYICPFKENKPLPEMSETRLKIRRLIDSFSNKASCPTKKYQWQNHSPCMEPAFC